MNRAAIFLISFLLQLLLLAHPLTASALIDPSIQWMTLHTDHFEIIYDAKDKKLAKRYALYAESSYHDLVPVFKEAPEKTVLWLNNLTDISNGAATAIPFPTIVVYPVNPTIEQSIGNYDHWGRELVTHEYAHILQFQPRHGIFKLMRYIFGSIITPNGLLPRWWLEGMAVEMESQFSNAGRLRSNRQQATLRLLASSGQLEKEDISTVNEVTIPDWLGGQRPYLFGSLLWNKITSKYGNQGVYQLNQHYSRRIPFLINHPIEKLSQKDYQGLLSEVFGEIKETSSKQIKRIQASQKKRGITWRPLASNQTRGILSPDLNHYAFIESGEEIETRLVIKSRPDNQSHSFSNETPEFVTSVTPSQRMYWTPDSQSIVYDKIGSHERYYNFSDLHIYNIKDKKSTQLTFGLRAREPAVSPNGKEILFIKIDGEDTQLAKVDLDGKNLKVVYKPKPGRRLSHPEFVSETQIVFSERNSRGEEILRRLDTAKKKIYSILKSFEPAYHPQKSPQGLLFVSEKNGVANIYLANRTLTSAQALSNVTTFADYPTWDPRSHQLLFSRLSDHGYQLWSLQGENGNPHTETPVKISQTVPYKRPPYRKPKLRIKTKHKTYSTLKYLIPRYWIPSAQFSTDGLFLSATIGSSDPVGKHAYSLLAGYDTGTSKPNALFQYVNQTTSVPISLGILDIYDFFGSRDFIRHQTAVRATGSGRLSFLGDSWTWGAGWEYQQTDVFDDVTVRQGPHLFTRYINLSQGKKQFVPNSGGDVLLSATHFIESLGDISFTRVQANSSYYFSKWLPKHHTLSAKLRTIYAPGINNTLGTSTAGGNFESALISNRLLMRGYLSGNFIARNAVNASLEYVFPMKYSYSGFGTWPIFSRHWHGRLIADVITLDGLYFDGRQPSFESAQFGKVYYTGAGGEIHWTTTIGYHMPLRFFIGFYYGLNDEASGGFQSFLGMTL